MTGVLADERMGDVDTLVWNVEQRPRNRTTIAALARFAAPLDEGELRHRVDRASRVVPRLRQRVVTDPLPSAPPRWSIDPDFRLSFHLRSVQLADGTDDDLARIARDLIVQPFDRDRPLWEFTHITGLADGGSALLLKSHHAVSDGVGGVELMLELFDLEPESGRGTGRLPTPPSPPTDQPGIEASVRAEVGGALDGLRRALELMSPTGSRSDVVSASRGLGAAIGSASRMFTSTSTAPVVPVARSAGLDLRFFSVPLDDLRSAGQRVDGTINDAFVAAVAVGVADHFGTHTAAPLRISIPINTRLDESGGNHWTPGRIDADLSLTPDIAAVMNDIRQRIRTLRREPAHALLDAVAAGLRRLPARATASLFSSFSSALDVAASNVPGSPMPLHLCGQEVDEMIPFGPLSGCGVNVTLLSHAGTAHIGVSSDPAAVTDPDGLVRDLRAGVTAVTKGS